MTAEDPIERIDQAAIEEKAQETVEEREEMWIEETREEGGTEIAAAEKEIEEIAALETEMVSEKEDPLVTEILSPEIEDHMAREKKEETLVQEIPSLEMRDVLPTEIETERMISEIEDLQTEMIEDLSLTDLEKRETGETEARDLIAVHMVREDLSETEIAPSPEIEMTDVLLSDVKMEITRLAECIVLKEASMVRDPKEALREGKESQEESRLQSHMATIPSWIPRRETRQTSSSLLIR